jgi:hypothetical protein
MAPNIVKGGLPVVTTLNEKVSSASSAAVNPTIGRPLAGCILPRYEGFEDAILSDVLELNEAF